MSPLRSLRRLSRLFDREFMLRVRALQRARARRLWAGLRYHAINTPAEPWPW